MDLRIGLLWHSLESGNLGVRALTLAQLAIIDEVAKATDARIEVAIFGNPPDGAPPASGFETERVRVVQNARLTARDLSLGLRRTAHAFRACHFVIDIGEGDSFTDVYGSRRYWKQIASKVAALALGRPLVLAPQTIGPFKAKAHRIPPPRILNRAEAVFARDAPSAAFAASLSGGAEVVEAADLAFRLPFHRPQLGAGDRIRVGLNVSGLLYDLDSRDGRFGLRASYRKLTDRLVAEFAARSDCELHLIPHVAVQGGPDDDAATCARLAGSRPGVVLAPTFADPREAKSYIAGMDFFVGARMHACIAAFSAGVPLLPLAYTRKATGVFGSLGYPAIGDLTMEGEDDLARLALASFERRAALVRPLEQGNALALDRIRPYEDCLVRILRRLQARSN